MSNELREVPFVTVSAGQVVVEFARDGEAEQFSFDAAGEVALATRLRENMGRGWSPQNGYLCSSSVDFPGEYGLSEDDDVHGFLGSALGNAIRQFMGQLQ